MKITGKGKMLLYSVLITMVLVGSLLSAGYAEIPFEAKQVIVNGLDKDVSPLISLFEQGRANLIASDTDVVQVAAPSNGAFSSHLLYDSFTAGEAYLFTLGATYMVNGYADAVTVRVYDMNAKKTIVTGSLRTNIDEAQAWLFKIPVDVDVSDLRLLIYAGEAGKTEGNTIDLKNLALYVWNENGEESQLAEQLTDRAMPVDVASIDAWLNSSSSDISAFISGYKSGAVNLVNPDPEHIRVESKEGNAYASVMLFNELQAGQSYLLTVGKTTTFAGTPSYISIRVYDMVSRSSVLVKRISVNFDQTQAWSFTIPSNTNMEDLRLVIYAGEAGLTAGNVVDFYDVGLYQR